VRRVLIISASMGAGHDRAAAELARRLEASGHRCEIVDFLQLMPFGLGPLLRATYLFQLRRCPWTYELGYKILGAASTLLWQFNVFLVSILTRRSVSRRIVTMQPDVVVSTYPFASLVLGHLRRRRRLRVPVATYLTDFAVHPLWVHGDVDLHLAVSANSAEEASRRGAGATVSCGPLVDGRFRTGARSRAEVRHELGIQSDERVALVVAGSLGFGAVPTVVNAIAACGEYHVITVCGNNQKLQETLVRSQVGGTVLGWTDRMPELMGAADVLVENAGGLTAMEAFAASLPVISFEAIAGHGRANARSMDDASVSRYALTQLELATALSEATTIGPDRDALIARGQTLFADDPAARIVALADARDGVRGPVMVASRPSRVAASLAGPLVGSKPRRWTTVAIVLVFLLYGGFTEGAEVVSALGVGVIRPPTNARGVSYVGVRLTAAELRTPSVLREVRDLHATAIVDGRTARGSGHQLVQLVGMHVDIANGGWGSHAMLPWTRARDDCTKANRVIKQQAHVVADEFVPGRELNAFDQLYCRSGLSPARLVIPNKVFGTDNLPDTLRPAQVYLLDGRNGDAASLSTALAQFRSRLDQGRLRSRPLRDLR
jgi:UDP-N-acetylglucosamine:LPS N-acetylglucosamine transferase